MSQWYVVLLPLGIIGVAILLAAGGVWLSYVASPPTVYSTARESAMDDLNSLLDTGLPSWRVHRDDQGAWRACERTSCPRVHLDYRPFHPGES